MNEHPQDTTPYEPTDAEVEAAAAAAWHSYEGSMGDYPASWTLCCDRWPGSADHYRKLARAALIAARKVNQP